MPGTVRAVAHPNIALVKYWGKRDDELNIPATPSLALTLGGLRTITEIALAEVDSVTLDGRLVTDAKLAAWLARLRRNFDIPPLAIESASDFPSSSGLASSASGFAALSLAVSAICGLEWSTEELCEWARRGSASAARSVHGGFAALEPQATTCVASQVLPADAWDLRVVIAINSESRKATSSTEGMRISRETSHFYDAWLGSTHSAFYTALGAVQGMDFENLANIAEASCRNLHALMLSSNPPLVYWNETTLRCLDLIARMREKGVGVFYTVDAGPHVKAVCEASAAAEVERGLARIQGVREIRVNEIGGAARLV